MKKTLTILLVVAAASAFGQSKTSNPQFSTPTEIHGAGQRTKPSAVNVTSIHAVRAPGATEARATTTPRPGVHKVYPLTSGSTTRVKQGKSLSSPTKASTK